MSAIVSGDYTTFKHVKTRKVVVLEIEISEEKFQEVISKLGMPIGGESKPVAVALLNPVTEESVNNAQSNSSEIPNSSEGEKLRVRAVMLCKDADFTYFCLHVLNPHFLKFMPEAQYKEIMVEVKEEAVKNSMYYYCNIKSRSEFATNEAAQAKFRELLAKFDSWKLENQYADNINRI